MVAHELKRYIDRKGVKQRAVAKKAGISETKMSASKEVWDYADDGTITEDEAVWICGPRPA